MRSSRVRRLTRPTAPGSVRTLELRWQKPGSSRRRRFSRRSVIGSPPGDNPPAVSEIHEALPAWSLPATAAAGIVAQHTWPADVTREWAWGGSTGAGVKVCILDSGIEASHPSVGGVANAVVVTADPDGDPIVEEDDGGDVCGHGTACAGIIRSLA